MNNNYEDNGPCVEAFVNHYLFIPWSDWTTEYLDRHNKTCRRCDYFYDIADQLETDYYNSGYKFIYNTNVLTNKLMVWAFTIDKEHGEHDGTRLIVPGPLHRNLEKDQNEYDDKFNNLEISRFYSTTFNDEALFKSSVARDYFWNNLSCFLYRIIDIENSPHIRKYDLEEERAKEEEIDRLLEDGFLKIDDHGRLRQTEKGLAEDYDYNWD